MQKLNTTAGVVTTTLLTAIGIYQLGLTISPAKIRVAAPSASADAASQQPQRGWVHPFDIPQADSFPEEVMAVIEIPQGSLTKYELDPMTGIVAVDRFQSMPVAYPANYGVITSSRAGDGDNLDILVLTREPLVPGALIRARPVGILKMLDGGEEDDKVIAVPAPDVDPTYEAIQNLGDLPAAEVARIEAFFRVYKQLPQGRKEVELGGFRDADETRELVKQAIELYQQTNAPSHP